MCVQTLMPETKRPIAPIVTVRSLKCHNCSKFLFVLNTKTTTAAPRVLEEHARMQGG